MTMTTPRLPSQLLMLLVCLLGGQAQDRRSTSAWPCGGDSRLLVDDAGHSVWVESAELRKHALVTPAPRVPSSARAVGTFTVDVLIAADGRVKCARLETGHPLLRRSILDAVRDWKFRPFSSGGDAVAISGHLDFSFGQ